MSVTPHSNSPFSPDSKFMIAMSRLGDLVLLNFFFLVTCLPVFTIGAASTALYTAVFRIGTDREQGLVTAYFRAFKANFKQATKLWLILLFVIVCTFLDVLMFSRLSGAAHFLCIPFVALLIVALLTTSYAFPLLSQFENDNKQTLKNALFLSLGYLPRSLLICFLNVLPFAFLAFDLILFMQVAFLWVFLYFSAIAYFNTLLLKKVFQPYQSNEEDAK